jgi:hypothetical protein
MLDEKEKQKIDLLEIKELGEKLALYYYGAMDTDKSRYAQHVFEMKKREENYHTTLALIGAIGNLSRSQKIYLLLQSFASVALVVATFVLAWITWLKK